jgi:acetoin utilization protein AcuB
MTEFPAVASSEMTVVEASELMKRLRIRHLPVVEAGHVVGIVSERDLKAATGSIRDVMSRDPYCVRVGTPLAEVAREMAKRKLGSAIVVDGEGRVVGIFTTTDGMRVLSEILDSRDQKADLAMMGIESLVGRRYSGHS